MSIDVLRPPELLIPAPTEGIVPAIDFRTVLSGIAKTFPDQQIGAQWRRNECQFRQQDFSYHVYNEATGTLNEKSVVDPNQKIADVKKLLDLVSPLTRFILAGNIESIPGDRVEVIEYKADTRPIPPMSYQRGSLNWARDNFYAASLITSNVPTQFLVKNEKLDAEDREVFEIDEVAVPNGGDDEDADLRLAGGAVLNEVKVREQLKAGSIVILKPDPYALVNAFGTYHRSPRNNGTINKKHRTFLRAGVILGW